MPRLNQDLLIKLYLAFAIGFVLMWVLPTPTPASPLPVTTTNQIAKPTWSRSTCGEICTVTYSPGGEINSFIQAADTVKNDGITLRIDGPCISACTIAVDRIRSNVCITPNANLRFHKGFEIRRFIKDGVEYEVTQRVEIREYYSTDILKWVDDHGGFPGKSMEPGEVGKLLTMPFTEAKKFFKVCK